MAIKNKLTTCLWFDKNAEEAVNFYKTVFNSLEVGRKSYYTNEGKEIHGMDAGTLLTIEFKIENMPFLGLNGGPVFKFNESVSIVINCETQEEIDDYWNKLSADPKAEQCGWLKDKFGLSWQVNATILDDMLIDGNEEQRNRVMAAMLPMKKLNIAALQAAYIG